MGARPPTAVDGSRRQIARQTSQTLRHLLARPVDVHALFKIDGHIADAVFGHRAHDRLVRQAEQLLLDGRGDPLLDLLRGHARHLQHDLDLRRRNIGKRVDRQVQVCPDAGRSEYTCRDQHQHALTQRELNQAWQHHCSPASKPLSAPTPATATRAPAGRLARTTAMASSVLATATSWKRKPLSVATKTPGTPCT